MPPRLPMAVLLTAALLAATVAGAASPARVVVQDPYLEFRSGPGRGYPVFHVVDRGQSVELLRRRTDWIKVRGDGGREGWVNRSQLERTLTPAGEPVTVPGPTPESRTAHRREVGLATGDLDGANVVAAHAAWAMTPTMLARADVSQLLGQLLRRLAGDRGPRPRIRSAVAHVTKIAVQPALFGEDGVEVFEH